MAEKTKTYWLRATLFAIAITVLGHGIQIRDGTSTVADRSPVGWLTVAIVFAALAVFLPSELPMPLNWGRGIFQFTVAVCLLANFYQYAARFPGSYLRLRNYEQYTPFVQGLVVEAVLCGVALAATGVARLLAFFGIVIVVALLGAWVIEWAPEPPIDVYLFQVGAADAIMEKYDPYELTFKNIYSSQFKVYGDGLVKDGRVLFGYPYFPETILAIMPARLLQVDVRYAELTALVLSCLLMVWINRGVLGFGAALLFVTTPRFFYILESSWIEPFTIATLAFTVGCIVRWNKLLPIAMGLFLASKQYVPAAALLLFVGSRPPMQTLKILIQASIVALIITLPMALWDWSAFWHSAIALQFRQPFRPDSMSYLAWIGEDSLSKLAQVLLPFLSLLTVMALVLWRRRSIGFAGAVAICFLVFFAFSKQAFGNYYLFIMAAMACGIAELSSEQVVKPKWKPSNSGLHRSRRRVHAASFR